MARGRFLIDGNIIKSLGRSTGSSLMGRFIIITIDTSSLIGIFMDMQLALISPEIRILIFLQMILIMGVADRNLFPPTRHKASLQYKILVRVISPTDNAVLGMVAFCQIQTIFAWTSGVHKFSLWEIAEVFVAAFVLDRKTSAAISNGRTCIPKLDRPK
jgi:hypothetical protein